MKIDKTIIECFDEQRNQMSLRDAVDLFCDQVADSLWGKRKQLGVSLKEVARDIKDNGTEIALENIQWGIAAKMLNDIGVTRVRTRYRKQKSA